MNNNTPAAVSVYSPYTGGESLVGRAWLSHDGIVRVTELVARNGMLRCVRADGRTQLIRPAIVLAALAESGV